MSATLTPTGTALLEVEQIEVTYGKARAGCYPERWRWMRNLIAIDSKRRYWVNKTWCTSPAISTSDRATIGDRCFCWAEIAKARMRP